MDGVFMKQGDTLPVLIAQLVGADDVPQDLTLATQVKFSMKNKKTGTVVINEADCTIIDALNGKVRYDWQVGDTASIGQFEGEFEVTFSGGKVATFPNSGNMPVNIVAQIA